MIEGEAIFQTDFESFDRARFPRNPSIVDRLRMRSVSISIDRVKKLKKAEESPKEEKLRKKKIDM